MGVETGWKSMGIKDLWFLLRENRLDSDGTYLESAGCGVFGAAHRGETTEKHMANRCI